MNKDMGASPSATGLSPTVEPASGLDGSATSIPSADDWTYTGGEVPPVRYGTIVWMLGRYGDVFGPLPFEMIDREAWRGNMGGASHDLVAYSVCPADWRALFPYQPRDPAFYGKRALSAAQGIETAKPPKREAGSARKGESPVGEADAPNSDRPSSPGGQIK